MALFSGCRATNVASRRWFALSQRAKCSPPSRLRSCASASDSTEAITILRKRRTCAVSTSGCIQCGFSQRAPTAPRHDTVLLRDRHMHLASTRGYGKAEDANDGQTVHIGQPGSAIDRQWRLVCLNVAGMTVRVPSRIPRKGQLPQIGSIRAVVDRSNWVHFTPQNPRLHHVAGFAVRCPAPKPGCDADNWLTVNLTRSLVQDETKRALSAPPFPRRIVMPM